MFEADSTDVASSPAQLQNGNTKSRAAWSSVMIIETTFRVLGLSAIGTRKQRILFAMWSVWFLARAVFMIAEYIILQGFNTSKERICETRSTILSSNGVLNRPLQTAIHMFDFLGWMLIFFSSLGSRFAFAPLTLRAKPSICPSRCCVKSFLLAPRCSVIPHLLSAPRSLHFFPRLCSHPNYTQLHSNLEKWLVLGSSIALFSVTALWYLVSPLSIPTSCIPSCTVLFCLSRIRSF
jgi:hypothetical protein